MQKIFDFIRYGSCHFTYIISSFLLFGIPTKYCTDIVSVIIFAVFSSILIFTAVPKKKHLSPYSAFADKIHNILFVISNLAVTSVETGFILQIFRNSSDNATTPAGAYVFAVIICTVSFICSLCGSYTINKVSNIIFVIPIIAFIISLFGFINSGISLEVLRYTEDSDVSVSIRYAIYAAILTFSDAYIISFMQKKEKCYNFKISRISCLSALLAVVLLSLSYKMMFGNEISSLIDVPILSAVGIISGFDLEETFLFVYSVSLLFRSCCRICAVSDIFKNLKLKRRTESIFTLIIFLIFYLLGAALSLVQNPPSWIYFTVTCLLLTAFVLLPICKKIIR